MNLPEIKRRPLPDVAPRAAPADGQPDAVERWHGLVAQMGAEIAGPLTAALERINALSATGKIDRDGLRALREQVEEARHIGIVGQQLTRFASGRLRQSHERLPLADMLDGLLTHRRREAQARGVTLEPTLQPAEVIADASLLFNLLNATLDWSLANAEARVDFAIEARPGAGRPRLICRFARRRGDEAPATATPGRDLDSLAWRLLEQTAWAMGVAADRKESASACTLLLDFPRPASHALDGVSAIEIDDGFAPSANSQPLAGSHVLVVASRREMRVQIRDALRNMSLIVDFVNSVDEAAGFCREGLPHAVIVESIQNGARFAAFRDEIVAEVPDFVFIEIIEEGSAFEMSGHGRSPVARVGRDVIATSLPSALIFELSRSH